MKVEQLFIYPIKSLRGSSVPSAEVLPTGFKYDRTFMLLKPEDDELKNMHVSRYPEMCLFATSITLPSMSLSEKVPGHITVSYLNPDNPSAPKRRLVVPLEPSTEELKFLNVDMHHSATEAYDMGANYSDWFSSCLGYPVVLAYIGTYTRPILGNVVPYASSSVTSFSSSLKDIPNRTSPVPLDYLRAIWIWLSTLVLSLFPSKKPKRLGITFADCAPLLTVTTASLAAASSRLPEKDQPLDVTKFRPNILVSGSEEAWDEDFWAAISVTNSASKQKLSVELTANCARCVSLNVDYSTGKFGTGEKGQVLKSLMKDRRVDPGTKYSPVFGRYGVPQCDAANGSVVSIGDDVGVTKRNDARTVFYWPGIST